ncbi:MAG: aldehyde ferredoxin oxidoreductase N-terminal domain-containing protein, partial [Bacillota bacterium]
MYGYAGKLLDIDLSRQYVKEIPLETELIQKYISGVGFSTKIVYDQVPPGADPLGPESVICFAVGVLTGTNIPTACRTEVSAKSPATELFGTSNSGSFWGSELKYAGYDGIIIRGRAATPVYLYITTDKVEILPALHLWGKDAWDTLGLIRQKFLDEEIQVAAIGPGGEKLCRFASIQNGPYDAWGRTGLGAVMGSKNLKAIAVRGNKPLRVHDKKKYQKAVEKCREAIYKSPFYGPFSKFGTMLATIPYYEFGALPGR